MSELNEKQIKHLVERFLGWKLPKNFNPDCGISYKPLSNSEPSGTSLFDYKQAEDMVKHMVEGLESTPAQAEAIKALEFYADEANWQAAMGLPKARSDQGDIARKALAALKEGE